MATVDKSIFYILLLTTLPLCFTGCRKEIRPTNVTIKDSVRHYHLIKQDQQLDIIFTTINTEDAPSVISEIQPSYDCTILDKGSHIITPEGGIRQFKATYSSIKNVDEVVHRIQIFNNILPDRKTGLKFDVNVVPSADYTHSYEELYQDFNTKNGIIKEMVDGKESELGYYVEDS